MPFKPGSTLGPYTLLSEIGAGGMGVVYKARDPKLDRLVAIKVLPASLGADSVLVARFEREAKAVAALSHPNVLGIFDFGREGRTCYAVMELLEGENLRARLRAGALTTRRALDIAAQIALGLAAAHEKGILHRDIKPENIFICKDGQVKVLDFGLAKSMSHWNPELPPLDFQLTAAHPSPEDLTPKPQHTSQGGASEPQTLEGRVVGTLGYMSPEQIRGEELDARSDIFSFGVVLYELLSGQRAFQRNTAALTYEAILNEDAPDLRSTRGPMPPVVESLVSHCLEKLPEARFQSMRDIAFALQHLDTLTTGGSLPAEHPHHRRRRLLPWLLGLGALLLLVAALLRLPTATAVPVFHRVNTAQGTLEAAFFGPDGKTIFYSARIQGRKPEIFVLHPDSDGPKALGIQDALLLGVSETGELALLRNPVRVGGHEQGLLAQAPAGGGSVKEILENVCEAVWDGRSMALLGMDGTGRMRVEFPSGHVALEENSGTSGIKCLRLAPGGAQLAMFYNNNNLGVSAIGVINRKGVQKVLFEKNSDSLAQSLTGLAWAPGGELWFSEWEGDQTSLWALSSRGRKRLIWRGEGAKQLLDISADGRVLLASQRVRRGVLVQKAGGTREISILEGTQAAGLSTDGHTLLLLESPALDGGTAQDQAFVYHLDEANPVKLARGNPLSLTPDGKNLQLAVDFMGPKDLDGGATAAFQQAAVDPTAEGLAYFYFMPTGPGRPRVFPLPRSFQGHGTAFLLGQELIFQGQEKEQLAWYHWTPGKGNPVAFTPEGLGAVVAGLSPISPDGSRFIATGNARDWFIVPIRSGGPAQPIRGLKQGERVMGWTADGRGLFVRTELTALPVEIWRLDPVTGARISVRSFTPPDPSGHLQIRTIFLTPDAKTIVYTYDRKLSELFQVEGLAK